MPTVRLQCNSLLLKRSLELLLKNKISPNGTIIISDHQTQTELPTIIIGKHLNKPFSKADLSLMLEKFKKVEEIKNSGLELASQSTLTIENEIEKIAQRFTKEILDLIQKRAQ